MCPNTSSNFEKSTKNWKNNILSWNTFWACKKIFQHKCSKNLVKFWRKGEKSKNQTKWKNLEKFGKIRKNSEKNGKIQKNLEKFRKKISEEFRKKWKKWERVGKIQTTIEEMEIFWSLMWWWTWAWQVWSSKAYPKRRPWPPSPTAPKKLQSDWWMSPIWMALKTIGSTSWGHPIVNYNGSLERVEIINSLHCMSCLHSTMATVHGKKCNINYSLPDCYNPCVDPSCGMICNE